jgi:hypothetical protein
MTVLPLEGTQLFKPTITPTFKWIPYKTKLLEMIYLFLRKRRSRDFLFLTTLCNDPITGRFVVGFSNAVQWPNFLWKVHSLS